MQSWLRYVTLHLLLMYSSANGGCTKGSAYDPAWHRSQFGMGLLAHHYFDRLRLQGPNDQQGLYEFRFRLDGCQGGGPLSADGHYYFTDESDGDANTGLLIEGRYYAESVGPGGATTNIYGTGVPLNGHAWFDRVGGRCPEGSVMTGFAFVRSGCDASASWVHGTGWWSGCTSGVSDSREGLAVETFCSPATNVRRAHAFVFVSGAGSPLPNHWAWHRVGGVCPAGTAMTGFGFQRGGCDATGQEYWESNHGPACTSGSDEREGLKVEAWCEPAVTCPVFSLVNGDVTYGDRGYLDVATQSCNPGFFMSAGTPNRTCDLPTSYTLVGEWTGTAITCSACNCILPNSNTSNCNATGWCTCLESATGMKCDTCVDGYIEKASACAPCVCHVGNTVAASTDCSGGQCSCTSAATGFECEICNAGFWADLAPAIPKCIAVPSTVSFSPTFGPVTGGTPLTFAFADMANVANSGIGECVFSDGQRTAFVAPGMCLTPPLAEGVFSVVLYIAAVAGDLESDEAEIVCATNFSTYPLPVGLSSSPAAAFVAGGAVFTANATNLFSTPNLTCVFGGDAESAATLTSPEILQCSIPAATIPEGSLFLTVPVAVSFNGVDVHELRAALYYVPASGVPDYFAPSAIPGNSAVDVNVLVIGPSFPVQLIAIQPEERACRLNGTEVPLRIAASSIVECTLPPRVPGVYSLEVTINRQEWSVPVQILYYGVPSHVQVLVAPHLESDNSGRPLHFNVEDGKSASFTLVDPQGVRSNPSAVFFLRARVLNDTGVVLSGDMAASVAGVATFHRLSLTGPRGVAHMLVFEEVSDRNITASPAFEITIPTCDFFEFGTDVPNSTTVLCTCLAGYINLGLPFAPTCRACQAGTVSAVGSERCEECLAGTYANETASHACKPCTPGMFSVDRGNVACQMCPAGTFSDSLGSSACHACPRGSFSTLASSRCTPCEPGSFASGEGELACTPCSANTYTNEAGASVCSICRKDSSSLPGATYCPCDAETYLGPSNECLQCPEGAFCTGDLAPPAALPGYFEKSMRSDTFFVECFPEEACLGGLLSSCENGYHGDRCSRCVYDAESTYYRTGNKCRKCVSRSSLGTVVIIVGWLVAAFVLLFVQAGGPTEFNVSARSSSPTAAIPLLITSLQVSGMVQVLDLKWPRFYASFFGFINFLSFDVDLVSPECSSQPFSPSMRTLFKVVSPIVGFFFICVAYTVLKIANAILPVTGSAMRERIRHAGLRSTLGSTVLLMVSLTFAVVVSASFSAFSCRNLSDQTWVLEQHPAVYCSDRDDWAPVAMVGACGLAYCLVTISTLGGFLFMKYDRLQDPAYFAVFGFMYKNYRPGRYWWVIVEYSYKFVIALVVNVLTFSPIVRAWTAVVVIVCALLASHFGRPFVDLGLESSQLLSFVATQLVLVFGLVLHAFAGEPYYHDVAILSVIVVGCVYIAMVAAAGASVCVKHKKVVPFVQSDLESEDDFLQDGSVYDQSIMSIDQSVDLNGNKVAWGATSVWRSTSASMSTSSG